MVVTKETTVADLDAHMKHEHLALRVLQLGTGYMVFVKNDVGAEGTAYGQDLAQAVTEAYANLTRRVASCG